MMKRHRKPCRLCGKAVRRRHAPKPYCSNHCVQADAVEKALTKRGPFDTVLSGHRNDFHPGQVIEFPFGQHCVMAIKHSFDSQNGHQNGHVTVLSLEPV